MQQSSNDNRTAVSIRLSILGLVFASGMVGLVYQVLWMRQLGLLFGNTVSATSTTLAAFFAGLATGSWYWGRRVGASSNPLPIYALLEFAIAMTALVYYGSLHLFYWLYPAIYHTVPGDAGMLTMKFAIASLLICPPAFFMGGTVPAVAQWFIHTRSAFGRTAAMLYGINTFGAALGVVIAVFVLVPAVGFALTYALGIAISTCVGIGALWLARSATAPQPADEPPTHQVMTVASDPQAPVLHRWMIAMLCFVSGFGILALEVLWTRMFAQVHSNSVYAFAIVLTIVLIGLALGAGCGSLLARLRQPPTGVLFLLLIIAGSTLALSPELLLAATDDLTPLTALESWPTYVARVFGMSAAGIGIVVIILGVVFPFMMKVAQRDADQPGRAIGKLLAINTFGSILGALMCGFVMLPVLGMWATVRLIAVMYLAVAILVPRGWAPTASACRLASLALIGLLLVLMDPSSLPTTGKQPNKESGRTIDVFEGSDCTVAVKRKANGSIAITVNSGYELGSTGVYLNQVNQSRVPLLVFPETRRIFFLGLGTGISAGASLDKDIALVEKIVSCELVPEVKTAAEQYIPERMTGGVFTDPRSTIIIEDGRHYLRVTDQAFDMINADLFLPYRRGAGSLYSLDHFNMAKKRLSPGGVYVQWLPLYQLTEFEFGVITRTMIEAFGQVTMWRNNFTPGLEIVALVGQVEPAPIAPSPSPIKHEMLQAVERLNWRTVQPDMATPERATMPFFYAGNLTEARGLFDHYPINTDDRPIIEYQTPRTWRRNVDQQVIWFVGPRIADLIDEVFVRCPIDGDPALALRSAANRRLARAGAAFHRSMVLRAMGDIPASRKQWSIFIREWRAAAD